MSDLNDQVFTILLKRGTEALSGSCLKVGEPGYATDTKRLFVGDGSGKVLIGPQDADEVPFSPVGGIAATDVQAAIAELDSEKASTGHTHAASAITNTPAGGIAATTVQAAIDELDTDKENAGTAAAAIAVHEAAGDPHTQYQKESEKGAAGGYAPLDGSTLLDRSYQTQGPDRIYRNAGSPESAVTAAVGSLCLDTTNGALYLKHTGAGNTGWKRIGRAEEIVTDHGTLSGLSDDDHSQYALADGSRGTFEVAGAVAAHVAAGDPHTGYQLESEKGAASGYAPLDGSVLLARTYQTQGPDKVYRNAGSPESAVTATVGSICLDTTNGELYVKNSGTGNTGWLRIARAAEVVTDHGTLSGLSDDDHTQYALADGSRGTFEVAGAVAAHVAAGDPHTGYQLESEKGAASGYAPLDSSTLLSRTYQTQGPDKVYRNAGSPESSVTATVGSICLDTTNGELYVKNSGTGNTGWVRVARAAELVSDHGALSGLSDDDHSQYALADGSRGNFETAGAVAAHAGAADPHTGYQKESERGAANGYAPLDASTLLDRTYQTQGPDRVYRNAGSPESAVTAAVGSICLDTTNGALYLKYTGAGNTGWKRIGRAEEIVTDHGGLSGLGDDDHTQYALADGSRGTFEVSGAVAAHVAAGDPHTGYQLESEKGAANGYAPLDASTLLARTYQTQGPDRVYRNAGSPESSVTANVGSCCLDTTNGEVYVKNSGSGNTGWLRIARASELVTDHGALGGLLDDDHTQYQLESEKGSANGYAPLDASTLLARTYQTQGPDRVYRNAGSPESSVTAAVGSCCLDTTNGEVYVKNSGAGNTGWLRIARASELVTDHGALGGLLDDDHTQYQLESEKGSANGYAPLDASTLLSRTYQTEGPDRVYRNAGSPESAVTAVVGSLCLDTTNGDVYIKYTGTGNTGWKRLGRAEEITGGGAPASAQYVVLATDGTLTAERVLTPGTGLDLTDGGAGGNATLDLNFSEFSSETTLDRASDTMPFYDNSATDERKAQLRELSVGVLDRVLSATTINTDNTERTLYSFSVPGGTLSNKYTLRLVLTGTLLNDTGSADATTFRIKYGATTLYAAGISIGASANRRAWRIEAELTGYNATNVQELAGRFELGTTTMATTGTGGLASTAAVAVPIIGLAGAEDSTADKTLAVTSDFTASSANLEIVVQKAILELV